MDGRICSSIHPQEIEDADEFFPRSAAFLETRKHAVQRIGRGPGVWRGVAVGGMHGRDRRRQNRDEWKRTFSKLELTPYLVL